MREFNFLSNSTIKSSNLFENHKCLNYPEFNYIASDIMNLFS